MSAPPSINPFYIEPAEVEDRYAWQDDTDDLDELLEHDASPETYHSPSSGSRRSRRRVGRLPVSNLAYDDDFEHLSQIQRRRLRLALLGLVCMVLVWTLASRKTTPHTEQKPINGRYDDNDEDNADDVASQQPQTTTIQEIAVLGERESGVSWLASKLKQCYPDLSVSTSLSREYMWFQDGEPSVTRPSTLVVSIFRNPYDWVEQMRLHPRFAPSHAHSTWEAFVTKPWTLDGYVSDSDVNKTTCQLGFSPNRVAPCKKDNSSNPAVYEMNPSDGTVFASVVDLRAAKIRHFVQEVAAYAHVEGVVAVEYERLVGDALDRQHEHSGLPGLLTTLNEIKDKANGLDFHCDVISDKSLFAPPSDNHKNLKQDFVDWMNANVNWDAEELVGYSQWTKIPPSQVLWDASNPEGLAQDDDDLDSYDDDDLSNDVSPSISPSKNSGENETTTAQDPVGGNQTASPETLPPTLEPTAADTSVESNSTMEPTLTPNNATEGGTGTDPPSSEPTALGTNDNSEPPSVEPTAPETNGEDETGTTAPTPQETHDTHTNLTIATEPPVDSPPSNETAPHDENDVR